MSTTTITGTINGVNNAALANKWITFRLVQLGTDSGATATVAQSVDSVQTDANGDFSINVWNNGDSGKTSVLEITIDGSKAESVIIPTGTATIELWDLIENYQADNGTSEQLPVVSELFLRKSNNLSDISNKLIASQNLDLEIGVDVQSYNAVLDATTASFTTAKDTAISTNTTNIATNATNIATNATNIATNATNIDLKAPIASPTFTGTINTSATGIDFNAGAAGNGGELSWNNTEKTLNLTTGSGAGADEVVIQIGQEVVLYAKNKSNVNMTNGQVVLVSGTSGQEPSIELAQADTVANARRAIGVITQDIDDNASGFVTLIGKVRGLELDDNTFSLGEVVYLSSTVAGGITTVQPDISVEIGHVVSISTGNNKQGVLEVQINNEASVYELQQELLPLIAINTAKIPNDLTTGTADGTTFLRGDNEWAIPLGGGGGDMTAAVYDSGGLALNVYNRTNHTGTQTASTISDFDVEVSNNTSVVDNSAKITNATHTGDVTGDTALTIATGAVDISMLSASGTPDATSFLRGDNTWSVPASGNTAVEYPYTTDFQSGVSQTRDLSGVLSIASGGYQGNANLTSLYIGSKITEIGFDSVQSCANLIDVTIPNSVTIIGDSSLLNCTGLTSITIPDSVLDIQSSAFAGCTGLTSVTIGENVSQILYGAFSGCNNVGFTEIVIPNSVNTLGPYVFDGCTALTSVTLPDNPSFTLLDAQTFLGCTGLASIIIPESVATIGAEALKNCTALSSISCLNTVAPTLVGSDVFLNVLATTIDVPIGAAGYGTTYGGLTVNYVL